MEKKELKLRKETLSNLTNLNIREMEELKGGVSTQRELDAMQASLTVGISVSWTVSWTFSWSF
jgi:hypothetical protein